MYAALWRILPGPIWLRVIEAIVLLLVVLVVLVAFVFPWLNGWVNVSDVTVSA